MQVGVRALRPPSPARERVIVHQLRAWGYSTRLGKLSSTCRAFAAPKPQSMSCFPRPSARLSSKSTHVCAPCGCIAGPARPVRVRCNPLRPFLILRERRGMLLCFAPDIEKYLADLNVGYTMPASIVSDSAWLGQVQCMPKYRDNAQSGIPGVITDTDGARL